MAAALSALNAEGQRSRQAYRRIDHARKIQKTTEIGGPFILLIDASDPATFPPELTDVVIKCVSALTPDERHSIKSRKITNETDVRCAIERYFSPCFSAGYYLYRDELIPLFDQHDLLCFHATRVADINSLLKYGIQSDIEQYMKRIRNFLLLENVEPALAESAIRAIRKEYNRKYMFGTVSHQVCFFLNINSFLSYDQYCVTVGGELAEGALKGKLPDVHNILQAKGIPVIAKCVIPFKKVADYHKDALIYSFVCNIAAKNLWNFEYSIEADSSLIGDIFPNEIIEIIEV